MLEFRAFTKNLRLTQRLIDDFLVNALGSMINDSFMISIAYFGFIYFFSKSRQKASLLSNRFAFKGVRNDNILLMIIDKGTLYG